MPLRASSRCSSSKMRTHLVEQGFDPNLQMNIQKNPQPTAEGLLYGAPGGIRTPDQVVRSPEKLFTNNPYKSITYINP